MNENSPMYSPPLLIRVITSSIPVLNESVVGIEMSTDGSCGHREHGQYVRQRLRLNFHCSEVLLGVEYLFQQLLPFNSRLRLPELQPECGQQPL